MVEVSNQIQTKPAICTAFVGNRHLSSGGLAEVAIAAKQLIDQGEKEPIFIFDDATAKVFELDYRGTHADVLKRVQDLSLDWPATTGSTIAESVNRGPGRPKLGVVAREVTLLPRHWDWLNSQPGGASVALRKLVEQAKRTNQNADLIRRSQEAAYRFMSTMAGDEAGFEEAARALFAANKLRFDETTSTWPVDIQAYAKALAVNALSLSHSE
jgi:uncharacterized protein